MSSLIEQAAQRLEQLRQAGVAVPELRPPPGTVPAARPGIGADVVSAPPVAAGSAPQQLRKPSSSKRIELDFDALQAAGLITPNASRTQLSDQVRVIKRPLIRNAVGKGAQALTHGNLIMVTSALAGEGKSFTSVNLAMSIAAELDHTVMLVDADVARPSLPRMLGLPSGPGLLDVLESSVDMSDALLRTNVDKLTVLTSGTPHPRATELLASEAMRHLLHDISTRYSDRIIIFDSPPLLLTTEARALATNMGQIVVVVRAEQTLQSDVQHALQTIENCPVRMMLLNQARITASDGYGYGGYGEGYGYGYGHQQAGAEADRKADATMP